MDQEQAEASPVLVCTEGALAGVRFAVGDAGIDLGRAPTNHVVIAEEGVSRVHARLMFDNGTLWLRDAGSRNGVYVNGARIQHHRALKVGDTITLGSHVFEIQWPEAGAPPTWPGV